MLPVVVTYGNLSTSNTLSLSTALASTSGVFPAFNVTSILNAGNAQQRLTINSVGDDHSIFFKVIGLNQAGFTVSEFVAGTNATNSISNLDYYKIVSVQPSASSTMLSIATTAASVSFGVNGTGSSLWNIVNWHVTPSNIEYACVLLGAANATFSIQYTYDDPNNLPSSTLGYWYSQPFNHPTIANATGSIDGPSNDPITAWRLIITGGTGTVRATGIQAGIGGP